MKKSRVILALLMILTMLAFAGCSGNKANDVPNTNGANNGTMENGTNGTNGNDNGTVNNGTNGVKDAADDLKNVGDDIMDAVTGGGVNNNVNNAAH